jgi:hypothetical protein
MMVSSFKSENKSPPRNHPSGCQLSAIASKGHPAGSAPLGESSNASGALDSAPGPATSARVPRHSGLDFSSIALHLQNMNEFDLIIKLSGPFDLIRGLSGPFDLKQAYYQVIRSK